MPKHQIEAIPTPECAKAPLGASPAVLAKRDHVKPNTWCPKPDIEYDVWCDPENPKTIIYKDVVKATAAIRQEIPMTPLIRSKCCVKLGSEVHYKFETLSRTGSFHERGALYALCMLNEEQRQGGAFTASLGNWAMALAYQGQRMKIPVTVVLPVNTLPDVVEKCQEFGASVVTHGNNLAEAKKQAFVLVSERQSGTYINGYDHPHVIAASGSIGLEILEQLPQVDAILVPIGGGGLIAGIATAVKQMKPGVLIYGIEPVKCCSFFKAMENERPYQTDVGKSLTGSLAVPTAGCNAFHTARSLIDKMVLVDDDWIARAVLHLIEEEKLVAEEAGAASMSALFAMPNVLPELRHKTIACVITGGNNYTLVRSLERAREVEGRIIQVTVAVQLEDTKTRHKVLRIIADVGASVLNTYSDHAWLMGDDFATAYWTLICETQNLEHACTLKRVMCRIFPDKCEFLEEPFSPIPMCACFPKRLI